MSLFIWAPDLVVSLTFGLALDGTLARASCATDLQRCWLPTANMQSYKPASASVFFTDRNALENVVRNRHRFSLRSCFHQRRAARTRAAAERRIPTVTIPIVTIPAGVKRPWPVSLTFFPMLRSKSPRISSGCVIG